MTPLGNQGISSQQAGQPNKQVQEKATHEDSVADHVGQEILHTGNGSPSAMHEHTPLNKIPLHQGNNSTFEEGAVNEMVSHCHDHKTSEVPTKSKLEELKNKKGALESKIEKQEQFIDRFRTFALAKKDLIQKKNDLIEVGNRKAILEKDKNELKDINGKIEVLSNYNQEEEDSQDWDEDLKDIHDQLAAKTNESMIDDEKNINKELKVSSSPTETAPSEQTLGEKFNSYVDDVTEGISSWMSAIFNSTPEVSGSEMSSKNEEMMQKQNEIKEDIQSMKDNIEILQNSTDSGEELGETIKEEAESVTTKFFSFCEDVMSSAVDHATQLAKNFENVLDQISQGPTSEASESTETQEPIKEEIGALESNIESLKEEVNDSKENSLKLMDINISQTINRVRTSSSNVNKMIQNEVSNSALSSDATAKLQKQAEETDQALQMELNKFDVEGQMNAIKEDLTAQPNRLSEDILQDNPNSLSENIRLETRIAPKKFNSPSKNILSEDNPNRLFENTLPEANAVPEKSFFGKMRDFSHNVASCVDNIINTHNRPLAEKTEPTLSQKISKKIYNTDMQMRSAIENRTEIKELSTLRKEYDTLKDGMDNQIVVLKNKLTQAESEGNAEDVSGWQEAIRVQTETNRYRKISFLETILSKEQEIEKLKRPNLASDLNYNDHVKVKEGMRFNRLENINVSELDKGISYLQSRSDKKPTNNYLKELIIYYEEIKAIKNQPQA